MGETINLKTLFLGINLIFLFLNNPFFNKSYGQDSSLELGVIGLTHGHVHWVFQSAQRGDIKIVGIVESDINLVQRLSTQYDISPNLIYHSIDDLLAQTQPEAIVAFGDIYSHLEVVEKCAPKGLDIMVEKPLAVNSTHAAKIAALAKRYDIEVLTNYETTWYATNHKVYEMVKRDSTIGPIRKMVIRDGHKGPLKIGVSKEFLNWLTDPKLNGGGATIDFGCYGANLATWMMDGKRPISVTAITHQLQKQNNPLVEDESIILLKYSDAVAVIQASWNWPIGRKDMEVYGLNGVITAHNSRDLEWRNTTGYDSYDHQNLTLPERESPFNDPFIYFKKVVRGKIQVRPTDLSSLQNNLIVVEILEAALESAKKNKTIFLKE